MSNRINLDKKTPLGCDNRRAFCADFAQIERVISTPVRSRSIITASDGRDRTTTATAATTSNSMENHVDGN